MGRGVDHKQRLSRPIAGIERAAVDIRKNVTFDLGRDGLPGTMDFGEGDGIWNEPGGLRGYAEQALFREGVLRDPPVGAAAADLRPAPGLLAEILEPVAEQEEVLWPFPYWGITLQS